MNQPTPSTSNPHIRALNTLTDLRNTHCLRELGRETFTNHAALRQLRRKGFLRDAVLCLLYGIGIAGTVAMALRLFWK